MAPGRFCDGTVGAWGTYVNRAYNDFRLFINGVCNKNGNIDNGDLIVTSDIAGYGQKQSDDLMRSCTVTKATCDCDFEIGTGKYKCFEKDGVRYALIGYSYHCS